MRNALCCTRSIMCGCGTVHYFEMIDVIRRDREQNSGMTAKGRQFHVAVIDHLMHAAKERRCKAATGHIILRDALLIEIEARDIVEIFHWACDRQLRDLART